MRFAWLFVVPAGLWMGVPFAAGQPKPETKPDPNPVRAAPAKPPAPATTAPAVNLSPDEQTLFNAHLPATGPALLEFFRQRTAANDDREAITSLVRDLGDKSAEKRDRATGELVKLGSPAIPLLREAANSLDDLDTAARARLCLHLVQGPTAAAIPLASARLTAQRSPAGAVEVLLAYLPFADNEAVVGEVE